MKLQYFMFISSYFALCFFNYTSSRKINITLTIGRVNECRRRWNEIKVGEKTYYSIKRMLNIVEINTASGHTKNVKFSRNNIKRNRNIVKNYFESIKENTTIVILQNSCFNSREWIGLLPSTLGNENNDTFLAGYLVLCKGSCLGEFPIMEKFPETSFTNFSTNFLLFLQLTSDEISTTVPPSSTSQFNHRENKKESISLYTVLIAVLSAIIILSAVVLLYWQRKKILFFLKNSSDVDARKRSEVLSTTYDDRNNSQIYDTLPNSTDQNVFPENIYATADNNYSIVNEIRKVRSETNLQRETVPESFNTHQSVYIKTTDIENRTYTIAAESSINISVPSDQEDNVYHVLEPEENGRDERYSTLEQGSDSSNMYNVLEQVNN